MKTVAVFGLGYVGCVTAGCLSREGHQVCGVDVDGAKVALVSQGKSPILEPGLDSLLEAQVRAGRLCATSDVERAVSDSEIGLITVGTPSNFDGSVNCTAIERVVQQIGAALRRTEQLYTVVIRSTLLPGVLEERLAPELEASSGCALEERLFLANNPEFLRETTAIGDYDDPPFVLVGAGEETAAEAVLSLYNDATAEKIVTDTRTAAMVKYASNAFHALKVGFANEIGALAKAMGANGQEVMRIVCRDTHLNISPAYLRPGFAFGGSCLPKDVRALARFAQQHAIQTQVLDSVLPSNNAHIGRALQMIIDSGCRRIGLVGLSFKAGTDDLRESPLVILSETLLGRGFDLRIYDPGVRVSGLLGTNLSYVEKHLPHLARLLIDDPIQLREHANLLVLGTNVADPFDWPAAFAGEIIDLRRDLVAPTPHVVAS